MIYLLVLLQVIMLLVGQMLWKTELSKFGYLGSDNFIKIILSPGIIAGIVIYIFATIAWFYILSREAFNMVYPLQLSLAAILGVVLSVCYLHESLSLPRLLGIICLVAGAFLITRQ